MSDDSASNSSSMSLRAPSRTSVLVRSSASVPCLAPITNCSANCPSCSAGGILVIGLGLLGVSLSGFSPTTDGSPDHSLFTDRLSHHPTVRLTVGKPRRVITDVDQLLSPDTATAVQKGLYNYIVEVSPDLKRYPMIRSTMLAHELAEGTYLANAIAKQRLAR